MSVKNFAKQMRASIEKIKNDGTAELYCDDIIKYLKEVEDADQSIHAEFDIENYKASLQSSENYRQREHERNLAMFESVIISGQAAVKASLFLNGGAAIALLAFIGHLASSSIAQASTDFKLAINGLSTSLSMFAWGALCAVLVAGLTYLTQLLYSNIIGKKCWQYYTGIVFHFLSIVVGILSYIIFSYGVFQAGKTFSSL